jgi:hypothetical protein
MTVSPTPLPAIGVRCWRDVISPGTGATVLSLDASSPEDPMVELGYDEGGGGWWPLSTLVFAVE